MDFQAKTVSLIAILVLWILLTSLGFFILWDYSYSSGTSGNPPPLWPDGSEIHRSPGCPALLLFLHPHCPCSRASLDELARILAHSSSPLTAWVVIFKPAGLEPGWEKTALYTTAESIPGVHNFVDEGGEECRKFDARTSGQVVFYDETGRLRFKGGITGSRGHEGDSTGKCSLISLLRGGPAVDSESLVFGCPLFQTNSSRGF